MNYTTLIRIKAHTLLLLLIFLINQSVQAQQTTLAPGFAAQALAEGLNPTAMALAPDGRIFLAQKDGRVLVYHTEDGELLDEPFVAVPTDSFNEKGLNGIALHPDFELQPWVYLYYTAPGGQNNRLSRVLANGDYAVPGSEQVLLELDPMNSSIHNGGGMVFGTDDKLYIGIGDGAQADNAQDLNTVLGKILRLNADGSIPVDNPFYNQLTGKNRAIYAYGVRNPFSMSFDPDSGKILFCDVGAEAWEEVNVLQPGANYGWKLYQGASGTPGYTDPLFAYDHGSGCAIVGAAFPFQNTLLIPQLYQSTFFFADYCAGRIAMLDPETGQLHGDLATGIDRPVSLLAGPAGDLYFLARAGLGGGSPDDNTASAEGVLWRVFWVGEGAPLIAGQPKPVLVAEGEAADFRVDAYGGQPIGYQWYRDGAALPNADSSVLILTNLTLADSGSAVFCIAANAWGADTSLPALISVSTNRRPMPDILLPLPDLLYRAGDTLRFAGHATDPEEGLLDPTGLHWQIDFHHDDHSHPGLPATSGIANGEFVLPRAGETSANVFYRISLSAQDQAGFSQTVHRDIFPEKSQILINGPAGARVNVDGQLRVLPALVESVIGMNRIVEAPLKYTLGDTVYLFRAWGDGADDPIRAFATPETAIVLELLYDSYVQGNGTGLLGQYFFDPEGDFDEAPVVARIDTTINFDWHNGTPDSLLPQDFFTVRWSGFVQPLFSENYTFSVKSDDGCRLWINEQLLIDKWIPQATTEHAGSIQLQAGKKYRIRLEYLELGGGANVHLFWQSAHQNRRIVPKRQLYPPAYTKPATLNGTVGLDTDNDGSWEPGEPTFAHARVRLYDAGSDSLIAEAYTMSNGRYVFSDLAAGTYYLRIDQLLTADVLLPVQNVNSAGNSPHISLQEGEFRNLDVAWAITQLALGGDVWLDEDFNGQKDPGEPLLPEITVLVYRADTSLVTAGMTDDSGRYGFSLLEPGAYFLVFLHQFSTIPVTAGTGLNAQGHTAVFQLGQGQYRVLDVAFVPDTTASGTHAGQRGRTPELQLYPNPVNDWLQVKLQGSNLEWRAGAQARVFDLTGRLVLEKEPEIDAYGAALRLDIAALAPGRYVLILENGAGRFSALFVKSG